MLSELLSALKSGDWITRERLRGYASILILVYVLAIGWTLISAEGLIDAAGRPIGSDFSNIWTTGRLLLRGTPELAYDPIRHHAEQQQIFDDPDTPFFGWHYPPILLGVAGVLGLLPYLLAFTVWQATTASGYFLVVRKIAPQRIALLLAAAFPAVFLNLMHGHNGFLTASLLGGGLVALRARPILAGTLFGLLAYKPQFGALLPFALAAGGHWRAFSSAAATVLVLVAATIAWLGSGIWLDFFDSLSFTTNVVLEAGGTAWHKQQSAFGLVRRFGGSADFAYLIQIAIGLASILAVIRLWRSPAGFALKAAGLILGTLLTTPYLLDYDMVALAPAIAFLGIYGLENGFVNYEKSVLAFAWFAPLFSRSIGSVIPVSLGLVAMILLMVAILAHAMKEKELPAD